MRTIYNLFFELIQVSLGNKGQISYVPSAKEWRELLDLALMQSLGGVLLGGIERLIAHAKELTVYQPVELRLE